MTQRKTGVTLAAIALGFMAAALLFVPRLGIEADEAMVANGIYQHGAPWYSWKFGDSEVPVMLISYLGALKTWLMNAWFYLWAPGPVSLRVPAILAGAATLWLFFAFLDRAAGRCAAWIGTLLLATDSSFLLIEATDFGFVALQFVFKLSALLLLLRFHRSGSRAALAGAFLLLGLAMWDKAVFAWVLFGLAVAAVAVFWREIRQHLTLANVGLAAAAMLVGALPLVIYNIARPLETLRSNAKVERLPVLAKARLLASTMEGYVLFGFLTAPEPGPEPGQPRRWFQSLSLRAAGWTGRPRHNLTIAALLASLLALWSRAARRPVLFGLIACAGAWLPMALTAGAGAAAQHVILLWPFHLLVIAVAVARAPVRWAAAVCAVLCLSGLAVTNQYYADLIRNGPAIRWTDAIDPLNRYLLDSKAERIFISDWGIMETLNLINQGNAPLFFSDASAQTLESGNCVFVSHTPAYTFQPQLRAAVEDAARQNGYEEQHLATISDRNGRPTFDVFRFRKIHL